MGDGRNQIDKKREESTTDCRIVIENLNVWVAGSHILKDISLHIPTNRITAVIGPSGCGKTTLLRCMNRLIDFTEGAKVNGVLKLDGEDILRKDTDLYKVRRKMGLLSQKPVPLPMSIYDNVGYGLKCHGYDEDVIREKVKHYLEAVGLWEDVKERLDEPAAGLSLGQQQRLCLARGLAIEPEVILCDEPTSALDPNSARVIEELLKKLRDKYTIILVTHILRQARRLADYVVFMYYGQVVEEGEASSFFKSPKNEKTRKYIEGDIS
ncbi:MAG: phosphate ABC transporter ATP-binding protein [Thermoplasmata archaeon]